MLYVRVKVRSIFPSGTVRSVSTKRLAGCVVYEINRDDIVERTR